MKSKKLFLTALVLFACILAGALAWTLYRYINPRPYFYTIDATAPLTEDLAIGLTRRALMDDSKAAAGMKPTPYWPDSQFDKPKEAERLFARNRIDPNNGYVIWSVGYHVRINRVGDRVECRVYSPK